MEQVLSQRPPVLPLVLTAALAVAACGPRAPAPEPPAAAAAVDPAVAPARRIVSLAPAFTETLIAIGAAETLVGLGRFDPEVPGRPGLPRLGDSFDVGLESVLALEPDLVLVNSKAVAESLRPASARLRVVAPPTDGLDDVLALIGDLGERTGHTDEARVLLVRIREAISASAERAARRRAAGARVPRVLVVVERRPLYVAGRTSFVADLLRAVGAENAVDDVEQPWPMLSEEAAVARAPDVILDVSASAVADDAAGATEAGRAALRASWDRFPSIPAVRDGRVLVTGDDAIVRAGPRIPEALERFEALLFPEERR